MISRGSVVDSMTRTIPVVYETANPRGAIAIGANARVNESNLGADPGQSVLVAAANDFRQLGVAGALAFGTVGVAPSANVLVVDIDVDAFIGGGALVNARNDVIVSATSSQSVLGSYQVTTSGCRPINFCVMVVPDR